MATKEELAAIVLTQENELKSFANLVEVCKKKEETRQLELLKAQHELKLAELKVEQAKCEAEKTRLAVKQADLELLKFHASQNTTQTKALQLADESLIFT
jgi:hypothetical protein